MSDVLVIAHHYVPWHPRVRHQLDGIEAAGLTADVICLRDDGEPARGAYGSARLYRLPIRRHRGARLPVYLAEYLGFFILAALLAAWLSFRRRHAVVVTHNLPDPLVFAAVVPRLLGSRVVVNLHEFTPELVRTRYGLDAGHPLDRIARLLERAACAFAHTVITVHEPGAELLAARGIPRDRLEVVNNTSEMAPIAAGARPPRDPGGSFTLLYHGTYGNEYDLSIALDALARLRDAGDPAFRGLKLRIVGDGAQLPALRSQAAALELGDVVSFEAPVPYDRVPAILMEADAGVVPLRDTPYGELGLPTKVLECIAMRLPVITTPGRATRHHLPADGVWFVPYGDAEAVADAIREIRRDPAGVRRRTERAVAALRPLRKDAVRDRYAEVMRESVAGG
jgi:glycosyltransferase involved in cell wall biosynthesis